MHEAVRTLPAVSAELALILAMARAQAATLPKKKREAFIRLMEQSLEDQAAWYNVVRVRSATQDKEIGRSVTLALEWWKAARPAMEKLPSL